MFVIHISLMFVARGKDFDLLLESSLHPSCALTVQLFALEFGHSITSADVTTHCDTLV